MKEYLEQLFFDGRAIKSGNFYLGDVKIPYELSTLSFEDQQKIDDVLAEKPGKQTAVQTSHGYIIELLSYTLLSYNGRRFMGYEDAKEFLSSRPKMLVLALSKLQGEFERSLQEAITTDSVDSTFSKTPSTPEELKQK